MKPAEIVAEIKSAGLVGRGGAAFPTGIKWEGAASAEGSPKYVVCNADESEPGTFKDRILLLDDPHTLIEGMLITGYAIGAERLHLPLRPTSCLSWTAPGARTAGCSANPGSGLTDIEVARQGVHLR
jgi:NADH:ubiquinone oxidoreductase subunit F (NADH-binding)